MLWTISGSVISINLCMQIIYHLCQQNLKGKVQRACEHSRLSAMTPSFLHICAETKRMWQPYSAIKQTIISHLKRRAFTCLVFMFLSVPWKTLSGPPCFTANKMLRVRLSSCLPLPFCFMFAYLFAFTYSYLRFGHSFLASWYLSIWAWPQRGKSLLWSWSWR